MTPRVVDIPAAWTDAELRADPAWLFTLDDGARRDLVATVRRARAPGKALLDYARDDFDLGGAGAMIDAAFREAKTGRGIALLRGLPRDGLSADEFELMMWAIGLHQGVARPQGKASQYISQVRNAGTDYRSATGRGYSSDAELDFHTDGCDVVALGCYNQGVSGGHSMVTSAIAAHNMLVRERPDLVETLYGPLYYSRQGEEAPDEEPFYSNPVFGFVDGRIHSKWNRNRVRTAQKLAGVPALTEAQRAATEALDAALRRPELMFTMTLQPGDLQLLDNHTMLHSRTAFVDHEDPDRWRTLYRLWLAPPDGQRLPESWQPFFRTVEPATVRGGIRGHNHDARCHAFEQRQAAALGMRVAV